MRVLCAGLILLGAAIYVYYTYDPAENSWFPFCPFKALTGLECPGCGSQRAAHALLHGEIGEAFRYNALFIPFTAYLTLGFGHRWMKKSSRNLQKWRKILFGEIAIKLIAALILFYFIARNIYLVG